MLEGLEAIKDGIKHIRESVVFWTATPKRFEKFEDTARQLKIPCTKKFVLDCKTRWNSTHLMLSTALIYKDVFRRLMFSEKKYKDLPTESEWHLAKMMCEKLKSFYLLNELFSGTNYPTVNLSFHTICEIRLLLNDWLKSPIDEIKLMASNMIGKFEKYWFEIHGVLVKEPVLDPRYEMKLIEYFFPRIYGRESPLEVERIRKLCFDLVKKYKNDVSIDNTSNVPLGSQIICILMKMSIPWWVMMLLLVVLPLLIRSNLS